MKLFLDGGDSSETKEVLAAGIAIAGQTTNPSLIAKNPHVQKRIAAGEHFSDDEITEFYKTVVEEIRAVLPQGSISIEVYADRETTAEAMLKEAKEKAAWTENAYIKLPITSAGLEAAEHAVKEGIKVNMTLCFSLAQAAAVYAATRGAEKEQVYISPFIGRLDDIGVDGMSLVENIVSLYREGDGHVAVLAASVRTMEHVTSSEAVGADYATVPMAILKQLHAGGSDQSSVRTSLKPLSFESLSLEESWDSYNIEHELTEKGLARFADDWNGLLKS